MEVILILISSLSFLAYGVTYFVFPTMKEEFIRFGLPNLGAVVATFQILGAIGLLVGLFFFEPLILVSSGGLVLLMVAGLGVRIKVKDSFRQSLPALFYFVLNLVIFLLMV